MSHCLQIASSFSKVSFTLGNPLIPFLFSLKWLSSSGSMPSGFQIDPSTSATPINLAPYSVMYFDAQQPTLPNPWTMKVLPLRPGLRSYFFMSPTSARSSRTQQKTPKPVDYVLPSIPPWLMALPVTQPRALISLCPQKFCQLSFIQLISRSPVPRSGPGTSIEAPMKFFLASSRVYLLVIVSSSLKDYFLGSILIPPFAPPYGRSTTAHFSVMRQERASISEILTEFAKRVPPLVGRR